MRWTDQSSSPPVAVSFRKNVERGETEDSSEGEGLPGTEVPVALAGLVAGGYLLSRRFDEES
jgi:PGF-CTERM protein